MKSIEAVNAGNTPSGFYFLSYSSTWWTIPIMCCLYILFIPYHCMKGISKRSSHKIVDRKIDGCIEDLKEFDKWGNVEEPDRYA